MKAARHILVLAAIPAAASVAQADMVSFTAVPVSAVGAISPATPGLNHNDSRVDEPAPGDADDLWASSLLTGRPWYEGSLPLVPAAAAPNSEIRELPGLPSSSSLFLSAVLSVGAWHVVRKAGHVHWAHLPEWYHPDAPQQIGCSVVFDLQYAPIAACSFDEPTRQRVFYRRACDESLPPRDDGRFSFPLTPRAPPVP